MKRFGWKDAAVLSIPVASSVISGVLMLHDDAAAASVFGWLFIACGCVLALCVVGLWLTGRQYRRLVNKTLKSDLAKDLSAMKGAKP